MNRIQSGDSTNGSLLFAVFTDWIQKKKPHGHMYNKSCKFIVLLHMTLLKDHRLKTTRWAADKKL